MFQVIPDAVSGQTVRSLEPTNSAREAALLMIEHDISAVVILEGTELVGLVTERDLARRVVGSEKVADHVTLREVMTANPDTIAPDGSTLEALEKMRLGKYRHLPIVERGKVVGMVSIRDLRHAIARDAKKASRGNAVGGFFRRLFT